MRAAIFLFILTALPAVVSAQSATPIVCRDASGSEGVRVPPALAGRVRSVCTRLMEQPDRYQSPRVRSRSGMETMAHGVAQLIRDRVDVEPLLKALQPRLYRLRFQPIGAPHAAPSPPFDVVVDGNANTWTTNEWPASTGLFRVSLHPALPMGSPRIGEEAWMLVDEGRFAQTDATFKDVAAMVDAWGDAMPEADAILFLRAALDDISSPPR